MAFWSFLNNLISFSYELFRAVSLHCFCVETILLHSFLYYLVNLASNKKVISDLFHGCRNFLLQDNIPTRLKHC